ncbi:YVTN family beta-propeller protein [Edaphobacter aggregans]|uniref:YVTN family beta-propeller protein n=1 Tax=Edaphobacter aggregans TaxID=570835 RepID=A0A3R9NZE3_9BACT|nr:Ig-like domain repeat protein [Edaphobacter aggregans]RSL18366.1 YVTN family beta-propeller protein [Edaphobacter aggregans]
MVLLKVLSWILRRRAGFLLLGLMAISAQLMGQSLVGTGSQPFAVAVNTATNKIYVVNRQGTVTIIDGATNTTETERVGGIPVAIAVNPVTNKAYVAGSDGTVTVIDEGQFITKTIRVDLNPQAIVVNPLTNKIYVAAANGSIFSEFNPNGNVSVIDGTDDTVKTTFPVGKNPFAIALNPVTNRIYVANEANGSNATVNVIDGSIDLPVGSPVRLGSTPSALAVNPVTNKIYVTNGSNLSVISGVSNTVVTTTPLPSNNLTAIAVNPVTNFIYITTQSIGIVMAVNGATDTLALSGIALIGGSPSALAVNSLTNLIYVTDNATTGHVVVIDGSSNNRVDSFLTGNSPGAVAANPVTNRVYVANFRDNNVAVVDGATKTTSTIIAGSNPNAVAVNQVTNKVYVPNFGDNTVTVIDAANGSTTSTVIAGTGPTAVAVNPATNKIYVPNSRSGDVTVIDGLNGNATTQVSAGLGPFAVAVNTVTNKAYVTNSNSNNVTVIDGITNETSNLTVGTTPRGLVVDEVTDTIVVANQGSNDITAFDGKAKTLDTVQVGNSPVAVGVNTAENNFYVVNQGSDDITVIDGDTLRSIDRIRVGTSPGAAVVNPLTNKIYVANQGSNSVSVIDGGRGNVIATVGTGSLPYALDLNLLTNKIYVTNQNGNTVTVIDGTGDTFSATVPTGTAPSGVAVNPVTNKVYVSNRGSANVTEITVGAQQPVPLNIALTPVVSDKDSFTSGGIFSTFNETPSFNVTVTSAYSSSPPYASIVTTTNPPPTQVYFSVDGVTPWSLANPTSASGANPASFAITLSPLDSGLHTLYVFATYGNAGGHNSSNNGTGNSPEISNLQRLPLLVLPTATTTALISDFPNGAQENTRITFTATVTANSSPVTAGMVQFKADGKTQGDPIPVNSNGVATDTNNTLTSGSHIIEAVYLGTDQFLENSASLTQIIYGLPTSITVSSGTPQTAAVNTSYASPLVAIVKDAAGDPVPNVPVTWATNGTITTADGTLTVANPNTDANGLTSVTVRANGKTGSFKVVASAVGTPAQFTLTNTAGAANAITISSGSPQAAVINAEFQQPLTVLVTDAGNNPVQGVTVTYVANGTAANASLSAPSAVTDIDGFAHVIATANGTTGTYTVRATAGSVGSANFDLTNNTAGTTTSLTPTTQTAIYGNTINFIANVNQPAATGAVNFFMGTELLGSATLNAGSATLALNQIPGTGQYLPVGTYSNITATYTGDNNFGGSSSGPVQVTVTKKTVAGGPALTVAANSVTRPFGEPNPPFSYTVVGTLVPGDTSATAVTGTAVYTTSAVPSSLVGTYPLSVSGLVSANYEIAFQDGTVTVTQGNSTTTIATASTNIMYGDQEVLTAAVTQGATGTVSFYEGSTLLGTASLDSATQAELPFDNLPVGIHTITATFNGGPNLLPSTSSPATVTVTQKTGIGGTAALTIVVRNATRPANGQFAVFTYYVTGQLFNYDTYETAITGTPSLASPAGSDPGTYPITISGLTSNNYTLTSVPGTLIVTDDAIGKPSTTTLTVNPSSGQYGDPITLTTTVSPTVASGRVSFYDVLPSGGTVFMGDATLSGGTATFVTSTLTAGTHSVEAAYSGDGIYSTSLSLPSTVTVAKKQGPSGGAALTITVQNASRQFGTANPYFAFIVTGTLLPGDSFESAVTGAAVYATTDTPSSPVGTTYPITVSGQVSQNYEIATVPGTLSIVAASSTTTLASASVGTTGFTAAQYGDTVTLTATIAPTTATGTVVFQEGQNVLGTAQVGSGTGIATLALSTLQAGRHTITATYLGDNNLGTSTSTPVTIVVSPKTGPSGDPYLIVTADDTSRIYGQANPAFAYTVSGTLLNGDTPATAVKGVPIYSTPASLGSPAGTYPVSIVGGLSSLNYLTEFQDGTFTVTPTSLTVSLASSANPVAYGSAVLFTATLPIDATGTVTFYDGPTIFGTGSISGGVATQLTSSLTAGTHSITAQYGGDVNYGSAVSTAVSQVVSLATPTVTLASSLNPSTFGASVTFTATLPTDATGTVTFLDGVTALGTGTIGTGIATLTTGSLAAGTHSITAQYGGDSNYSAAVSTPVSQVVNKASSTVALASSPNPSTFGTSVTLTATIPSGATGTVTFDDGATSLGTGTISGGVATLATGSLTAGTHSITAQYGGDTNYIGAVSTGVSQVVNKATPAVTLASSLNPSTFGVSVTLTATVPSGATGTVTFDDGATSLGTGAISGGGATLTISSLAAGTHSITAQYGGDTNYTTAASTAVSQIVNKASPTVTLASSLNPSTFGVSATLTATVPSEATGIVTFDDGATSLGTGTISSGVASLTTSSLAAGTHSITAQYGGDTNYNGATSSVLSQVVNKASSTVALATSLNPSTFGTGVTLTATVTSGATGTVTFEDGTTSLGTGTINSGVATLATSSLAVGTHSITAQYGGDANYTAAVSTPVSQVVNKAIPTVTLASSLNPSTYGTSLTLTAAVPAGATGTVTFEDNGTAISGAVPISGTTAAFAISTLVAGSHAITAVYSGDTNYNGTTSLVLTQTVNMATTGPSTTLSVSPAMAMYGDPAVLTAVVGPPSGATGTVSFHEGTTLLGTSSLDGSTTAVLPVSTLNVGTHTITATYNGDVNFPASTSNPVTLTVTQRTAPGGGAALTVTVNDATRTTTEANPPFSHTVAGELVNGDTYATAVSGTPTYSTTAGTTAGTFEITLSGLTSQNYTLAFVPGTLTVVPSSSTTTLTASPNSLQYGGPVTLTATVTSGATGTASFYDSSVFLGEGTVTGGVATLITTTLNAGTHTITAIYNGDATYASSTSGPATVTVAKKTAAGGGPALTVTVENASREYGTANPEFAYIVSGTLVNGDTYATAVTGVPVYTSTDTPTSPVGSTFPINVSGLVSENYTLTTVPGTLTIVTAPTTTALTTSVTSTQYGDPVTLTATVGPSSATGTVVFSSGSTALGTGTVSGGTATLSTSALSVGTYTITASYEGDGNYAESTSSAVTVTVVKRTGPGGVAALTVMVTDASRQYGQGNPAFSYSVSGTLVNGDTYATAVTGVAVYSTPATVTAPVGTYPVSITGGLNSANYSLAFVNGTLTVSKGTPTVTVASSLNPSSYGSSVIFTATVPSGATGTVTFEDNGTEIGSAVPISGITVTFTTSTLVAGTHPIIAVYSGDSNYNGATSSVLTQVVNQATLTVTANDASRPYGTPDPPFTSTMIGFANGDTQESVVTGSPSLTTTATTVSPAGTYPITAAPGDLATNNNYIFTYVNGTLTVTPAAGETTTLSVNPTTVMYGNPAVLTAVVGPTAGATGTVSFHEGTTLLGTSSLDSSATAVLSVSTLNAGTHTITATYNGDLSFPASTSNPVTLTVTQRTGTSGGASLTVTVNDASRTTTEANPPFSHTVAGELVNGDTYATAVTGTPTYSTTAGMTTGTFEITVSGLTSQNYVLAFVPGTLTVVPSSSKTTLAASPNSSQYGDRVTLTATVTSGATGTASFYDGSVYLGQGTVTGGVAALSTTTLNAGTHTITATYNGDATYASSMSEPTTVTVAKKTAAGGAPALTVTVLNESREYGTANPEFSYIVSGTLLNGDTYATAVTGVPVYSVAGSPNSPVGSTFPINVSGLASQNYTLTTVPGTLTIVTAATTTTLTTSATSTQYGDPLTLTATVAASGATGTVVFSKGSTVLGTAAVSGGTATLSTSALSAGTNTITASYEGDGNYAASTSSPVTAIVTPRTGPNGGAALTVTVTNASRQYGQGNPAFSYTVTGTLVNGDTYSTAVTGVPVYSTTATVTSPVGTYPISIIGGLSSPNYSIAFVNGILTVSKGTPSVAVASSQNPSTPAASVTFTATLSAGATGTVTFMDGTTVMGTGLVSSGTASFSTSTLSVGTHSVTATYNGDGNYNGVTSPALSQVVNKTAATVTLASSRNPVPSGSSVTFTATVPAGSTGTVQFLDGMTVLGAGTVSGGTASLSTTTLSVGTHSITAVYSGDATYNGATSSAVSQVVQTVGGTQPTFTVASTTGPQLIPPGASASYSITVTPVNGAFNNVVTLTATNLPPGSSYSFAPPILTPGSAAATSTFTVNVPKQSAALRRISKTPFALAVLLLPLAFLRRTRARPPRLLLWLLLGLTSSGAISGCGSGGYFNQPQQTYTITITATSGSVANSSTVTLTVQ